MRLAVLALLCAVLASPAGAASKGQQCRQACGGMIAACAQSTAGGGFGNLTKACKQSVLARCRREGPAVCGTFCGNGVANGAERCDGGDLRSATCASVGFASGRLGCTSGCGLDTSGCVHFPPTQPLQPPTCGNGVVDAAEQCDGTALGGATCASLGFTLGGTLACTAGCGYDLRGCSSQRFPETGQTTPYVADKTNDLLEFPVAVPDDGTVQAGKSLAYVDNGDGTITDLTTGLMWERKGNFGGLHDVDKRYTWSSDRTNESIWDWLDQVNAEGSMGFAGHSDWRIPNVKELQSIVSYGRFDPAVEPAFNSSCDGECTVPTCSCTARDAYWSSTTLISNQSEAWVVSSRTGAVDFSTKVADFWHVRAVRGGS